MTVRKMMKNIPFSGQLYFVVLNKSRTKILWQGKEGAKGCPYSQKELYNGRVKDCYPHYIWDSRYIGACLVLEIELD